MRHAWLVVILVLAAVPAWADFREDLELGFRAQRRGDLNQAVELYTKVIRSRDLPAGNRASVYLLRGEAYRDMGETEQAVADFTRALRVRPNYAQAFYFRGLIFEKLGRGDEALKDLKKAHALRPDNELYREKLELLEAKLMPKKSGSEDKSSDKAENKTEISKENKEVRPPRTPSTQ
ncbi:MAG: tetratricopeptide repeat protein [Thermodesulfobacteriota bacterium]